MKAVNLDDVLRILHKYGTFIFVTDDKKYSDMVDEIANVEALEQKSILDKARAEINSLEEGISSYHNDRPWLFKDEVLKIIDKYIESEE